MTTFNLQESAKAYAKAAERVLGEDAEFLHKNQELVPVFVALLFQSIEISLKHLGIEAAFFTEQEARDKKLTKNGHGVREIADLVNTKLRADKDYPVVNALTAGLKYGSEAGIIRKMLFGSEFEEARKYYQNRNLGYAQLNEGDFALIDGLKPWVTAVRNVAENLPTAIGIDRMEMIHDPENLFHSQMISPHRTINEKGIDHGPGYSVYYKKQGQKVVILLAGGDKRTQARDIKTALRLAQNL